MFPLALVGVPLLRAVRVTPRGLAVPLVLAVRPWPPSTRILVLTLLNVLLRDMSCASLVAVDIILSCLLVETCGRGRLE